jgi:diguanylate cyclase (GGDEF)-like protein
MTSVVIEELPAPSAGETLKLLLDTVGELSLVRALDDVTGIVRAAARRLLSADGATFVLRESGECFYADEDAISPLWKGQRFPLESCISGWAMLNGASVAIEDIYADARIPHEAYRPTFVQSLVIVPIRTADPLGAIGVYWARRHRATDEEMRLAQALADSTAVALAHVMLLSEFAQTVELSETDPLTGIANRRTWDRVLGLALKPGRSVCLALLDLDDLKQLNDTMGHQAGDELLQASALAWSGALRTADVVARYGGDEFAVLMPDCDLADAGRIVERLRSATPDGSTVSIGLARWDGSEDVLELTDRADKAMYEAKHAGRDRIVVAG